MGLILGGVPPHGLILDGQSVSLYAGGSPPVKVWPTWATTVQITLGTGTQARDQFRAALTERGLDYTTVTEVPFEIELVGTGSTSHMFRNCYALTSVPAMDTSSVTEMRNMFYDCAALTSIPEMDTSQVTDMGHMFRGCSSLTYVPDLSTSGVTDMYAMFYNCSALTDGNVRLIGRHPDVNTDFMINNSGLTREPFYKADGTPDDGIEVVQIPLGTGFATRDAFRSALTSRGLDYQTVTELPFDIEFVGTGEAMLVFQDCFALTTVPEMDLSGAWNVNGLFQQCFALTSVPPLNLQNATNAPAVFAYCHALTSVADIQSAKMTNVTDMFTGCTALKDGNVRLMGKNPNVNTTNMISGSGLTREPFYKADGTPDDGTTSEVHEVTITNATGTGTAHPLLTVTVPAGETWDVRIQGTITKASQGGWQPFFRIGTTDSGTYGQGAAVDFSGTVTPANSTIALVSNDFTGASFTGTVTIEK